MSPANAKANNGNWHTAARWARFLSTDYAVSVVERWGNRTERAAPPDVLLALHARRSAGSIAAYRSAQPKGGLIVALTGTDVYRDIQTDEAAQHSLQLADRLIVLQPKAIEELSDALKPKCDVVFQSARALKPSERYQRHFDVVQVGHLRHEKDPFTPITALRMLPDASRVRLTHIGNALDSEHADAMAIVARNEPRLNWLGGVGHAATRARIKRAHLLVIASRMEGGANVIVEAVTAGVPVIASRISGNIGMLGDDYPGYFPLGDSAACAALMSRAETDASFYARLCRASKALEKRFMPLRENRTIQKVVRAALRA